MQNNKRIKPRCGNCAALWGEFVIYLLPIRFSYNVMDLGKKNSNFVHKRLNQFRFSISKGNIGAPITQLHTYSLNQFDCLPIAKVHTSQDTNCNAQGDIRQQYCINNTPLPRSAPYPFKPGVLSAIPGVDSFIDLQLLMQVNRGR